MKLYLDLNKSLKECPPQVYYTQSDSNGNKLFPGVKHIKRLVLNRDLVSFKLDEQIREQDAGEDRVEKLIPSYRNHGFIYSKAPQAIMVDPSDPNRFSGVAGFGRNEAQNALGIKHIIYDVLEFDTPRHLAMFKANSNDTSDHVPATPNTKNTLVKCVKVAIENKLIKDDDVEIMKYIKEICRSRPDWHKSILSNIRTQYFPSCRTMRAWNTEAAKKYAEEHEIQYEGRKNKKVSELGYVRKFTTQKNVFWDSMILSAKNNWQKVGLVTWVDEPNPATLYGDRKKIEEEFAKMEDVFQDWTSKYLDMPLDEVREKGKGRFPLELKGFLPQDIAPNPENGGLPTEDKLVKLK